MADQYYFESRLIMPLDDSNFNDYSLIAARFEAVGTASTSGSSLWLDGAGSWIQATLPIIGLFGRSDFTIEMRIKTNDTNAVILDTFTGGSGWQVYITTTGRLAMYVAITGDIITSTISVNDDMRHHVALSRVGGVLYLFIDGMLNTSRSILIEHSSGAQVFAIGAQVSSRNAIYDYRGYVDNLRIIHGVGIYTTSFTPAGSLDTQTKSGSNEIIAMVLQIVANPYPNYTYHIAGASVSLADFIHGGKGRISGTTKIKGTPNFAVRRRVRLMRERDGMMIRETWSDPVTGAYSFDNIDENYQYTVISFDHDHNHRAVIADNLTPELMP